MILNDLLKNVKVSSSASGIQELNIIILGEAKTGKTTLIRDLNLEMYDSIEETLLIKFEDGVNVIEGLQVFPKEGIISANIDEDGIVIDTAYEVIMDLVETLIVNKEKVPFKTLSLDTIDEMYKIFEEETLKVSTKRGIEKAIQGGYMPPKPTLTLNEALGGFGAGAKYCNKLIFDNFYTPLKNAGYKFQSISHTRLAKFVKYGEESEEFTSTLPRKTFDLFKNDADIVLFLAQKDGKTRIIFRDDGFYKAGSRVHFLPDSIELDAKLLVETVGDALRKTKELNAGKLETSDDIKIILEKIKGLSKEAKAVLKKEFKELNLPSPSKTNLEKLNDAEINKIKEILKIN